MNSNDLRLSSVFVTFLLGALPMRAQSPAVQLAFQHGAAALHEGRYQEAELNFREAVRLDPKLPEARLDLGLVLGREGKNDEAVASLESAIQLNPGLDAAHMFLGVFLYQSGQMDRAAQALQQELVLHPKSVETLSWLGIVELAAGRPELAVAPLDTAVALAPDDLNLLEYRGRAHSQVAQASYGRMAQLNPNAWQVHKVRAELYASENKDQDSVTEYQAALATETRNPDLYEGLGDAYRRLNQLDLAKKAYAEEWKLAPQNPIAMYNLGSTDVDLGNSREGLPLLQAMLKVYRSSATAEYYLGRGLAETEHPEQAVPWLEKGAADGAGGEVSKRSYYDLARLYRRLHRTADAERSLAAYNRLRAAEDERKAQSLGDWRKLNPAVGQATAPTAVPALP